LVLIVWAEAGFINPQNNIKNEVLTKNLQWKNVYWCIGLVGKNWKDCLTIMLL
jgi:hypothetical protein